MEAVVNIVELAIGAVLLTSTFRYVNRRDWTRALVYGIVFLAFGALVIRSKRPW